MSVIFGALFPVSALLFATALAHAQVPPTQLEQARSLEKAGDFAGAQSAYEAILKADPASSAAQQGEAEAVEHLALQLRARGDNDGALRMLLAAQPFAPRNATLLYDLGVLEDSMKLYWDADRTVGKLERTPSGTEPKVLYLAARVKMDLGQLDHAEQKMRAYLVAAPGDATAHFGLGRILQLKQQPDAARSEFLRSAALRPQQTESYFELGELALEQHQYQDAIADYAKTLAANPAHGGALAGTGQALYRLKQYGQAADTLRRAVAAAPDYQPGHYYLGLTLARLGQKAESDRELARAAEMSVAENRQNAQRLRLQPGAAGASPQ